MVFIDSMLYRSCRALPDASLNKNRTCFGASQKRQEPAHGVRPPSFDLPPPEVEIRQLHEQMKQVAGINTCYNHANPKTYLARRKICPLVDHCYAAAWYINQKYGGLMIKADVELEVNGKLITEPHYWNEIGGREYDVTGSQYGGDGFHALDDPESELKPGVLDGGQEKIRFVRIARVTYYQTRNQVRSRLNWPRYRQVKQIFEQFKTRLESAL